MNILEVEEVAKRFPLISQGFPSNDPGNFVYALNGISFSLLKGENLGIIGKNGSGKSTLLKILSGIIKPDKGVVKIYGSFASILDLGFGMVPELSGRDNIFLIGSMSGYTRSQTSSLIDEIVSFAELEAFIDQPVKTYSNGMYLRLSFAIKTTLDVDLLILDEVMSVGDIRFQEKCKLKIRQLNKNGTSIIMVTHNLREVEEYTRHTIMLDKGEISDYGNTIEVINHYEAMTGLYQTKADPANNDASDPEGQVRVIDFELSNAKIKMDETISCSITFQINRDDNYDLMVFVSDSNATLLSDSFSYRHQPIMSINKSGTYHCICELPSNFFNKGIFFVGYIISDRRTSLYENLRCLCFEVVIDEKAAISPWSIYDKRYSLRPELKWSMQKTGEQRS